MIEQSWNKVTLQTSDILFGVEGRGVTSSQLSRSHQTFSVTHGVSKAEFDLCYIWVSGTAKPVTSVSYGTCKILLGLEFQVFADTQYLNNLKEDKGNVLSYSLYFLSEED